MFAISTKPQPPRTFDDLTPASTHVIAGDPILFYRTRDDATLGVVDYKAKYNMDAFVVPFSTMFALTLSEQGHPTCYDNLVRTRDDDPGDAILVYRTKEAAEAGAAYVNGEETYTCRVVSLAEITDLMAMAL